MAAPPAQESAASSDAELTVRARLPALLRGFSNSPATIGMVAGSKENKPDPEKRQELIKPNKLRVLL